MGTWRILLGGFILPALAFATVNAVSVHNWADAFYFAVVAFCLSSLTESTTKP